MCNAVRNEQTLEAWLAALATENIQIVGEFCFSQDGHTVAESTTAVESEDVGDGAGVGVDIGMERGATTMEIGWPWAELGQDDAVSSVRCLVLVTD